MFRKEARWLAHQLSEYSPAKISPLLNIGSSTKQFREIAQPWTVADLFEPLSERSVEIIHLDQRAGDGINIKADLLDDGDFEKVSKTSYQVILCCNVLEHVIDRVEFAKRCFQLLVPGGLLLVTVPRSYPRHGDPIDTLYRPTPAEIAQLFPHAVVIAGDILNVGESYRDAVAKRPWILLRHIPRFFFPFIDWEKWKASMQKPYWLFHNYQVSAVVLRKSQ